MVAWTLGVLTPLTFPRLPPQAPADLPSLCCCPASGATAGRGASRLPAAEGSRDPWCRRGWRGCTWLGRCGAWDAPSQPQAHLCPRSRPRPLRRQHRYRKNSRCPAPVCALSQAFVSLLLCRGAWRPGWGGVHARSLSTCCGGLCRVCPQLRVSVPCALRPLSPLSAGARTAGRWPPRDRVSRGGYRAPLSVLSSLQFDTRSQ